jgi:hypothetical protein
MIDKLVKDTEEYSFSKILEEDDLLLWFDYSHKGCVHCQFSNIENYILFKLKYNIEEHPSNKILEKGETKEITL